MDECSLLGAKPAEFPMEQNHKLALAKRKNWKIQPRIGIL